MIVCMAHAWRACKSGRAVAEDFIPTLVLTIGVGPLGPVLALGSEELKKRQSLEVHPPQTTKFTEPC